MANTVIQIKRSSTTATPSGGSLAAAEPAYSYSSDKLFLGDSAGTGVIEIGGRYFVNVAVSAEAIAIAAYGAANAASAGSVDAFARDTANAAYNKANSANLLAFEVGGAVTTANTIASAAFDKANAANVLAFNTGIGANAFAAATIAGANAAVGAGANAYSDSTFVKLTSPNQTITGNLSITGSLTVSGNSYVLDTETLRVSDPLIYLAGNNYLNDIVDIGFVANYNNGSANLHTGLFREHTNKQYYLFQGYTEEPFNNHIDPTANGFTLAVLNADLITSNLTLGGQNTIVWITSAFDKANAANLLAFQVGGAVTSANAIASAAFDKANTANVNAANASFLTEGTVPSGRLTGSYTGITGVGTLTAGTWNADTITVPYGGTGMTSFTQNGILYGNTSGALKVTVAGTEGQVLQASLTGVPQFGMLDGGTF